MLSKVKNILLNLVFGVRLRYRKVLKANESSRFLRGFSIISNSSNSLRVTIGKNCLIGAKCIFENSEGEISIGNNVYIGDSTIICKSKVSFESNILVAWGVTFYDHDSHSINYIDRQKDIEQVLADFITKGSKFLENKDWSVVKSAPIHVEENAWIGMDALILKGVTIGKGAIVGARSVVTKDVPPYSIVAGNPAKVVKVLVNSQNQFS